jgi:cysteine synthase A
MTALLDRPEPPPTPRHGLAALVGNTPVLRIGAPLAPEPHGFWAKLEGCNPGGIKDRAGLHLVRCARERGDLAPGAPLVESTSGTLGLGLALAGLAYGHPVTLVTDPGLEPLMLHQLRALGARVESVPAPDPVGGWQQARRDRVHQLLDEAPGGWCPDQYNNPDNPAAYTPLAWELADQLGRVDVLVCAVGTGGHSAGTARALRRLLPELRLVGVDSIRSTVFGQPAGDRLMRGLGSSIHPRNVDHTAFDEVHWVAPNEAVHTARLLARHHYVSGGWSVGAVAQVAAWIARTHPPRTRIAAVFPDAMHRYWDTVYNDAYCATHDLLDRPPAQHPDEITHPAEQAVERWTRCTDINGSASLPSPTAPEAEEAAR